MQFLLCVVLCQVIWEFSVWHRCSLWTVKTSLVPEVLSFQLLADERGQKNMSLRILLPKCGGFPRTSYLWALNIRGHKIPVGQLQAWTKEQIRTKEEAGRKPMRAKEKAEVSLETALPLFQFFTGDKFCSFREGAAIRAQAGEPG